MNLYFDPKFGEYRVWLGDQLRFTTGSKIEAIESVQNLGGHITWHFNDEVFGSYNWQKPIAEDISEIYHRRAQQIRDQYKKVVVMYSGGFDSHNMLMSFLDNGIKVDAVCTFYNSLSQDPDDYIMVEWYAQTWPKIQALQNKYPGLEFFRMDTSYNSMSMFDTHWEDWLYLSKGMLNPSSIGLSHLHKWLPGHLQSDSTCLLFGVDKPRLRFKDNEFRFFFLDCMFRPPITEDSKIEYFYWSPAMPEMIIKQAQIAKKYWQENPDQMQSHKKNKHDTRVGIMLDHEHESVQRLVYPHCAVGTYLTWQPKDFLLLERDWWLIDSNTEYATKMQNLVQSYTSKIRLDWFNQQNTRKGLIGFRAGDYLL
jgi:hypothetical protein